MRFGPARGSCARPCPTRGYFLFSVPRSELNPTWQFAWIRGVNSFGYGFQRQGFTYRVG